MEKTKKSKIIIREIKPKMKIIESKEKQPISQANENSEAPLEEIISDAPSSREFPSQFGRTVQAQDSELQRQEQEISTPSATTTTESSMGERYAVQQNVTEIDIRRTYQSRESSTGGLRNPDITMAGSQDRRDIFRNREIDSSRGAQESKDKYAIDIGQSSASQKRKLPWE